jgi:hypothetical protein
MGLTRLNTAPVLVLALCAARMSAGQSGNTAPTYRLDFHARAASVLNPDGLTVFDNENNVTWLADANLPASVRFGLPVCTGSSTQPCVNPSGSMTYQSAVAWVKAMNAANYLGHTNWQLGASLPPVL